MVGCSKKCTSTARLDGKTAIITGCNTGIGQFTAMDLYKRGCKVIMACRNTEKAEAAREQILKDVGDTQNVGELVVEKLDLSSLASVREFSEKIMSTEQEINILIDNAGVMMCPKSFTTDGFEMQFGTNHIGHFLLTLLLLPRIIKSAPARIVVLSSDLHKMPSDIKWDNLNAEKSYSPSGNYGLSKLANVLFVKELASRLEGTDVNVYAVHPGVVDTELNRHMSDSTFPGLTWFMKNVGSVFLKTVEQGSQTSIYCAVDEKASNETGLYYSGCKPESPSRLANNPEYAKKLWDLSTEMVQLPKDFNPFVAA